MAALPTTRALAAQGVSVYASNAADTAGVGSGIPGLGATSTAGPFANPVAGLGQGVTGIASTATTDLGVAAIGALVSDAATSVLHETAHVLAETTTPHLESTWFSSVYWRVAGIAAILTLPFLFAAAVQALIRSDLTLLLRAALGYLPLAMLAVAVAAPLTMLMLSASDELAAAVSSAAGQQGVTFLDGAVGPLGAIGLISGSPFLGLVMALFTVAGALTLWMELLVREAAVYVIVLLLPLAFAAFVWPARRIWALRSVEVLMALVLSKFAIVAVLSLGGSALAHGLNDGLAGLMAGVVLLVLGAFAPWALLRLFPLAEIASGTAGALRSHSASALSALHHADDWATLAQRWVATTAQMRRAAGPAGSPTLTAPADQSREDTAESAPEATAETPDVSSQKADPLVNADVVGQADSRAAREATSQADSRVAAEAIGQADSPAATEGVDQTNSPLATDDIGPAKAPLNNAASALPSSRTGREATPGPGASSEAYPGVTEAPPPGWIGNTLELDLESTDLSEATPPAVTTEAVDSSSETSGA